MSKSKKPFPRRDFIRIMRILGLDVVLGAIVGWNYIDKIEPDWVQISKIDLKLPRLPRAFSGFRLVQISDIHLGYWMTPERFSSIVEMIKEQFPDLIAITGDIVLAISGMPNVQHLLDELSDILKSLTNKFPAIAVLGNHDHRYNAITIKNTLESGGVKVLMNSVYPLERNGDHYYLAGVDNIYDGRENLGAVLAALPKDGGAMLLAHEPDFADTSAATGRFDLQISGHSHGGQVVLPLIGPLILPKLGRKYPEGLYRVGNMYQYTNRGVGMTMPSVRFNCRPEITVFTLKSA